MMTLTLPVYRCLPRSYVKSVWPISRAREASSFAVAAAALRSEVFGSVSFSNFSFVVACKKMCPPGGSRFAVFTTCNEIALFCRQIFSRLRSPKMRVMIFPRRIGMSVFVALSARRSRRGDGMGCGGAPSSGERPHEPRRREQGRHFQRTARGHEARREQVSGNSLSPDRIMNTGSLAPFTRALLASSCAHTLAGREDGSKNGTALARQMHLSRL